MSDGLDELDEELSHGGGGKKGLSGKRMVLLVVLPILLIGGGGAALVFSGLLDSLIGGGKEEAEQVEEMAPPPEPSAPGVIVDLPPVTVNLTTNGRRASYLKIDLSLEVNGPEDAKIVEQRMPRIMDQFQVFLRELRADDLEGSEGMYRVREELRRRVARVAEPAQVRAVLFGEFLMQ